MNEMELEYDQAHALDPGLHPFRLDARLAADTLPLGRLPLCDLLLMNDARYPWFILVPRRADVSEIFHLSATDQNELIRESSLLALNLVDIFDAHKMNVAALGNQVRQLHLHHVVRYEGDPAWPGPVWGQGAPVAYREARIAEIRQRVCTLLADRTRFEPVD